MIGFRKELVIGLMMVLVVASAVFATGGYRKDLSADDSSLFGEGTPDAPFMIHDVWDLQNMNGNLTAHYALAGDIDASLTEGWNNGTGFEPVGNHGSRFIGGFDGRNFTVSGLYINRSDVDYIGLFGFVGEGGEVRNVSTIDTNISGLNSVGGLVGYNLGYIFYSHATGTVNGNDHVGGLVGYNLGSIHDSISEGDIKGNLHVGGLAGRNNAGTLQNSLSVSTVEGNRYVGGLVGSNSGMIHSCEATGNVTGGNEVGGLVGINDEHTISDSFATGDVTGVDDVGGLVGRNNDMISNCHATGKVSGVRYVGGLVGRDNGGTIQYCYATGDTAGDLYVGGLAGRCENGGAVVNCHAVGNVTGNQYVGGLLGLNWINEVHKSFATGKVLGNQFVGGLFGTNDGLVTKCYSTGNVSGEDVVGGFVGNNLRGRVYNSYARGVVTRKYGSNLTELAGFVGRNIMGKIINCYSTGSVHYEGTEDPTDRGFCGGVNTGGDYEMYGNFWDVETSGQNATLGEATGKTSLEMQTQSTFTDAGWDFSYVWWMIQENMYPIFRWQDDSPPSPPLGFTATGEDGFVNLSWQPPDCGKIDHYSIYRGVTLGEEEWITDLTDVLEYKDEDVINENIYFYSITATNPVGEGAPARDWATPRNTTGTPEDPHLIRNVWELQSMKDELDAHYMIVNDIYASPTYTWNDGKGFLPVGLYSADPFTGCLDGGHFNISKLFINPDQDDSNYKGLFGYIGDSGAVKNTVLVDAHVNVLGQYSYGLYVGGLVGYNRGTITNSRVHGSVGGLHHVGGIMGWNQGGTIEYSHAEVSVTGDSSLGGVVGSMSDGDISYSSSMGYVEGSNNVGGLAGSQHDGDISGSHSSSSVIGTNHVGGLVGYATMVIDSYASGDVSGSSRVGGIAGINTGSVTNSYSTGFVTGASEIGGLVGYSSGTVSASFWDVETSGISTSSGGWGKFTSSMKNSGTFEHAGWDFVNLWAMKEGYTYPFFRRDYMNEAPTGMDDHYSTNERTVLTIVSPGVLVNDHDPDLHAWGPDLRDSLEVINYQPVSDRGAAVMVYGNGSFSYDPTEASEILALGAGEILVDSFTYTLSDIHGMTDTARVFVTVQGVNSPPMPADYYHETQKDTLLEVLLGGLLEEIHDADGDELSIVPADFINSRGAVVVINVDGSFTYDPRPSGVLQGLEDGEWLLDTFTYTVMDIHGTIAVGTVTVNITGLTVYEETSVNIELYAYVESDGWNLVSFNVVPESTDIVQILEHEVNGIRNSYDRVMYYDASTAQWLTYVPGRADHFNTLRTWDHTMGLWIRMLGDDTLTVEGIRPNVTDITLYPGWNMVGYSATGVRIASGVLPEEVTKIGVFSRYETYNVAYFSDLSIAPMGEGRGYWVYNAADHQITWTLEC